MRTTAEYELFPDAPSERALARARWLAREGRVTEAADAYREVLASHPLLKPCWAEYFELLRRGGRAADALRVAEGAAAQFGESAFALTLKGAALTELGRYREALAVLDRAVESDPDLALVWHELGYAAYRLGDGNRALLALDRAFALEPHTETLRLRGRILRDAGRYQAAEVAFEGAAQAAEHREQREEAEREIATTRRYVFYAPRRRTGGRPGGRRRGSRGGRRGRDRRAHRRRSAPPPHAQPRARNGRGAAPGRPLRRPPAACWGGPANRLTAVSQTARPPSILP